MTVEDELRQLSRRTVRFITTALSRDAEHPDTIDIRFATPSGGRPIEVSIRCGHGLLASDIRRLPWTTWITLADETIRTADLLRKFAGQGDLIALEEIKPHRPANRRPGRRGHDDEHYQRVAENYRAAITQGHRNPTAQVAASFVVTRSTAAGWVRACRARGYLPPARRGRAG
jgi:hypothetical protein